MEDDRRFEYKGRILQSGPDRTGENIIYGYEASSTEANRIITKYGNQYVYKSPLNEKDVVMLGVYYGKDRNRRSDFTPSGDGERLQGITNVELVNAIYSDRNFYTQATGIQISNSLPTDPNQPGASGASTPVQAPPNQGSNTINSDYLTYPIGMKGDQDRIMFQAYDYKSGEALTRLAGVENLKPSLSSPIGQKDGPAVFLPIQSAITDQNAVGWDPDTLNPIEMYAVNASLALMTAESNVTQVAGEKFKTALERLRSSTPQIRTYLAGQAVGVNNLLSRLNGQVLNPNLELLFQGPQLRPFNFTFKLSPRSEDEAAVVKTIIRYFKQNMAVKKDSTGLFLEAPNVFKIQYQYGNGRVHLGLNLIKMCALTSCSVDYTPNGTYMTYPEGTMVSYSMTLSFQELTPIYSTDYKEFEYGNGDTVKYDVIGIGA